MIPALRWLRSHFLLLVIYGAFLTAAWKFVPPWICYAGVENWPSVPATVAGETGASGSYPTQGSWGIKGTHRYDNRRVHFTYEVAGRKYEGDRFSPDGGGLPGPGDYPWRAHYKPAAPEIAVLDPKPFEGIEALLWMAFTGIAIVIHMWCGVSDFLARKRKAG
jgi:hypothetical protein